VKYVVLIGDGMGDYPLAELNGRTILEAAHTPNLDTLAKAGRLGLCQTIPASLSPGSDVANMAILGYDPEKYLTGRGPLEAGSMGVPVQANEQAFRLNLVTVEHQGGRVFMRDHAAGNISSDDARILVDHLAAGLPLTDGQKLYPGVSYRHLLLWPDLPDGIPTYPPHDHRDQDVSDYLNTADPAAKRIMDLIRASWPILENHPLNRDRIAKGLRPANSIWPWGQGRPPAVTPYPQKFGVTGAVVSAVDLIKGLGVIAGLEAPHVPGATGLVDTNYEGKVQAALKALETGDFVLIHVEAPDEAGHQGDIKEKLMAVERFDQRVVGPMWEALQKMGPFRLLVLCDHFTPIEIKTHTREPVPFILYPDRNPSCRSYSEIEAATSGLYLSRGDLLADLMFGKTAA
jgi:2,3-bisphosphoglycerate-independent phosphoglycerate mutase